MENLAKANKMNLNKEKMGSFALKLSAQYIRWGTTGLAMFKKGLGALVDHKLELRV